MSTYFRYGRRNTNFSYFGAFIKSACADFFYTVGNNNRRRFTARKSIVAYVGYEITLGRVFGYKYFTIRTSAYSHNGIAVVFQPERACCINDFPFSQNRTAYRAMLTFRQSVFSFGCRNSFIYYFCMSFCRNNFLLYNYRIAYRAVFAFR